MSAAQRYKRFTRRTDRADHAMQLRGTPSITVDGTRWLVSGLPPLLGSAQYEPLSLWRSLSRRADAILRINAALKDRGPFPSAGSQEWEALGWEKREYN